MNYDASVVIPLHNRSNLIRYTLASLSPDMHPGVCLQVIVIDDMSSDAGPTIVQEEFPWVTLVLNSGNKGASACRNQGTALLKSQAVLFLDSDDLVEDNFFRVKLNYLQREPNCVGVYGPWECFESDAGFHEGAIRPRHSRYSLYSLEDRVAILENLLQGWFIPINATLWRTEAVNAAGGFNPRLKINQDVDFFFRMLLNGRISGLEAPRALIRMHGGERVGQVTNEEKLKQILELRSFFLAGLEERGLLSETLKRAMATYCFGLWSMHRKKFPGTSDEFLKLSRELHPGLKLRGTPWLRVLASLFGNTRAIQIKQWLRD